MAGAVRGRRHREEPVPSGRAGVWPGCCSRAPLFWGCPPYFGDALAAPWLDLQGHARQEGTRRSRSRGELSGLEDTAGGSGSPQPRSCCSAAQARRRTARAAGQGRSPAGQGRLRAGPRLHDTRVPFALRPSPPTAPPPSGDGHLSQPIAERHPASPALTGDGHFIRPITSAFNIKPHL